MLYICEGILRHMSVIFQNTLFLLLWSFFLSTSSSPSIFFWVNCLEYSVNSYFLIIRRSLKNSLFMQRCLSLNWKKYLIMNVYWITQFNMLLKQSTTKLISTNPWKSFIIHDNKLLCLSNCADEDVSVIS